MPINNVHLLFDLSFFFVLYHAQQLMVHSNRFIDRHTMNQVVRLFRLDEVSSHLAIVLKSHIMGFISVTC